MSTAPKLLTYRNVVRSSVRAADQAALEGHNDPVRAARRAIGTVIKESLHPTKPGRLATVAFVSREGTQRQTY